MYICHGVQNNHFFFLLLHYIGIKHDNQLTRRQNLVGLGWKQRLRWRSCLDGLMICIRKAFKRMSFEPTFSPVFLVLGLGLGLAASLRGPRWRLQRKEPGWVVGEHRHVLEDAMALRFAIYKSFAIRGEKMEWPSWFSVFCYNI